MEIDITIGISSYPTKHTATLYDLGVTEQEWNKLSKTVKEKVIARYIEETVSPPYFKVESFNELAE